MNDSVRDGLFLSVTGIVRSLRLPPRGHRRRGDDGRIRLSEFGHRRSFCNRLRRYGHLGFIRQRRHLHLRCRGAVGRRGGQGCWGRDDLLRCDRRIEGGDGHRLRLRRDGFKRRFAGDDHWSGNRLQ